MQVSDQGLKLSLSVQTLEQLIKDYQLKVDISDHSHRYQKILPLAYGLFPSSEWRVNEGLKMNYWINLPQNINLLEANVVISLVEIQGGLEIGKWRSTNLSIDKLIKDGEVFLRQPDF